MTQTKKDEFFTELMFLNVSKILDRSKILKISEGMSYNTPSLHPPL